MQTYEEIKQQLLDESSDSSESPTSLLDGALQELQTPDETEPSPQFQPGPKLNHDPVSEITPPRRSGRKILMGMIMVGAFFSTTISFVLLLNLENGTANKSRTSRYNSSAKSEPGLLEWIMGKRQKNTYRRRRFQGGWDREQHYKAIRQVDPTYGFSDAH